MEAIKDGIELPKRKRWRPRKNSTPEIVQTLDETEELIPEWKVFNINEIADINPWTTQIITLKWVKTTKTWEKYITINWRKYYEYNGQWEPKKSMYILKSSSLFIWDRFEWLTNRDGVSFRYSSRIGDSIDFEQRKTKYTWWAMHLKDIYKSETLSTSEVIAIVRHWWKIVKITKDMLDQYPKWWLSKTANAAVEAAIATNPDVFAYITEIM